MTRYEVSGYAEVVVWREVEAETVEEARAAALELPARLWDRDDATMEVTQPLTVTEATP